MKKEANERLLRWRKESGSVVRSPNPTCREEMGSSAKFTHLAGPAHTGHFLGVLICEMYEGSMIAIL
jgi:hypothetical protein